MRVGEFLQALRGLSKGEFARARAKDFGQVSFCYYRKVLVLFRRQGFISQVFGPGLRDVLLAPAVALTFADRLPAPI